MVKRMEKYETTFRTKGEGTYSLIEQLEQICKREGWSLNLGIRKALEEYVVRHGAGNCSFQLDKFGVTWTKAQSVGKCGFAQHPKGVSDLAVGVALYKPKHQVLGVCGFHVAAVEENIRCGGRLWADLRMSSDKELLK